MKPFNLQEALAGKKVVTRSGCRVEELHLFKTASPHLLPLVGIVEGRGLWWTSAGKVYDERYQFAHENDLFMASEKKSGWINIYRQMPAPFILRFHGTCVHASRDAAILAKDKGPVPYVPLWIDAVEISWEE
jgi:hypothetical protein